MSEFALDPRSLPAVAAFVGLVIGWLLCFLFGVGRRQIKHAEALREAERVQADKAVARAKRELEELTNRWNEQSEMIQYLPDTVKQLFATTGPRQIGPAALAVVDRLFRPEQAAIFVSRPTRKRLALAAGQGLPATLTIGLEIEYGEGRVGYAATGRVAMDSTDFRDARGEKATRVEDVRRDLQAPGLSGLRPEVVAPIVAGAEVLGVISMGGVRARRGQEKKLLAMVAELTAIALTLAARLKATEQTEGLDGLTGVCSKPSLMKRIEEEIKRAGRDNLPLSVLFLDVDHLEQYNRNHGSRAGDEVLCRLASILSSKVRKDDIVARFGGEEFVVVFVGAPKELALRLAENVRSAVEAFPFAGRAQQPFGAVTVSGGLANYPEDSKVPEILIRCADEAMQEAKEAGRNRIVPAKPNYLA